MLTDLLRQTKDDITAVRRVLRTNEQVRSVLFTRPDPLVDVHRQLFPPALTGFLPDVTKWRIFDHVAAITRLYALFERCVRESVKVWLRFLPLAVPAYTDLSEHIRAAHRRGIAKVLQNLEQQRFRHISLTALTQQFNNAISGVAPYELNPEAFLFTETNFRRETIEAIYNSVSINEAWKWIHRSRFVIEYLDTVGRGPTTPESELREFVGYRNDAAHGLVDQVLGIATLLELADFIEALCTAVCEMVTWEALSQRLKSGSAVELGETTEGFKSGAVVAKMNAVEVALDDKVYIAGESCCLTATVKSIHVMDVPQPRITVAAGTEVGFMFDVPVPKNRKIYRW